MWKKNIEPIKKKKKGCFFEWSQVLKESPQGKALHPLGAPVGQIKSLWLCCGQQMHPIKQDQGRKGLAIKLAGQFETK